MTTSPLSHGDSAAYIDAIIAYLGDRDPLETLADTPAALHEATGGLNDTDLRRPEAEGKWSVIEVVRHLADVELVLGFRYRTSAADPGKPVPSIDQDAWARELLYSSADLDETLNDFERVRAINLAFLRRLPDDYWERYALHSDRGRESVADMVRLYAAHDCYHLKQIERIKQAAGF